LYIKAAVAEPCVFMVDKFLRRAAPASLAHIAEPLFCRKNKTSVWQIIYEHTHTLSWEARERASERALVASEPILMESMRQKDSHADQSTDLVCALAK
jgi:hypothetical protein